jgi:hypothetical protein
MESHDPRARTIWLAAAVVALALSGVAALSALAPLLLGLQLIACELRARAFRKVQRLEDLAAAGTPLGDALNGVKAAEARAHAEGARRGLVRRSEGFFYEDRDGRGDDLNRRLAHLFVMRQQLAYDFDLAARRWSTAMAWRDVTRLTAWLFIGAFTALCLFERPADSVRSSGHPQAEMLRLAASGLAIMAAFTTMRLVSRSAALALVERLSEPEPLPSVPPHVPAA